MKFFSFLFVIVLFVSCEDDKAGEADTIKKSDFSKEQNHMVIDPLTGGAAKKVDHWQEYIAVRDFLNQYSFITPNEALNNSRELNNLVKALKDSVTPNFLDSHSFAARINLLHNETLRLFDMSSISSIKSFEINDQVLKIMEAFSSLNSKINTLVQQADLEVQLDVISFSREEKKPSLLIKEDVPEFKKVKRKSIKAGEKEQKMRIILDENKRKRNPKHKRTNKNVESKNH